MTLTRCPREPELLKLLHAGQWPASADPDLRTHALACRRCTELVTVAQAFQSARSQSLSEMKFDSRSLPSPGLLWWRAQLRRRNEAVERIARPISRAQIFALVVNLLVAAGLAITQRRHLASWLGSLSSTSSAGSAAGPVQPHTFWPAMLEFLNSINHGWNLTVLISSASALLILGGLAVYLTGERH
jgi:hypothetical protein